MFIAMSIDNKNQKYLNPNNVCQGPRKKRNNSNLKTVGSIKLQRSGQKWNKINEQCTGLIKWRDCFKKLKEE